MLPFSVSRRVLALQRRQVLGQLDGLVVEAVELLHDEVEVGGEVRLGGEAPDQGRDGHEGGQQQQDVREELGGHAVGFEEGSNTGLETQKI